MFSCRKATCQTSFGLLLLALGQFSFIESNCHPYKKRKKKRKEGLSNKYIESTYNDNATNLLFLTISTFLWTCLEGSGPRKCKKMQKKILRRDEFVKVLDRLKIFSNPFDMAVIPLLQMRTSRSCKKRSTLVSTMVGSKTSRMQGKQIERCTRHKSSLAIKQLRSII